MRVMLSAGWGRSILIGAYRSRSWWRDGGWGGPASGPTRSRFGYRGVPCDRVGALPGASVLDVAKGYVAVKIAGRDQAVHPGLVVAAHDWSPFMRGFDGRVITSAIGALLGVHRWGAAVVLAGPVVGYARAVIDRLRCCASGSRRWFRCRAGCGFWPHRRPGPCGLVSSGTGLCRAAPFPGRSRHHGR